MNAIPNWPEHRRPCWLKGCPYVAWGYDERSAKLALRDHIEKTHPEIAPALTRAGAFK